MRPRAVRNLLIALTVVTLAGTGPFVEMASASAYTYNCDGTKRVTHDSITKDFTPTAYYIKAVAGDAAVRQLAPCNQVGSTFGAQWDEPYVWLADLQAYDDANHPYIVQVGYARCGFSTNCGGTPGDGNMYMVYTDNDHNGGFISQAGWYNFGRALTIGHRYRGRITAISGGWQICARDITTGQSYQCATISYTWPTTGGGNFAWWGPETNNYASQMGVAAADPDFNMDYMQYLSTQSGAAWTVRTDLPSCSLPDGNPSWYHCVITSTVYNADTLFAFTALH
jgi:hypothetical protein